MFFTIAESEARVGGAVDEYGDSFARDIAVDELEEERGSQLHLKSFGTNFYQIINSMPAKYEHIFSAEHFKCELEEHGNIHMELPGWMFEGLLLYTDRRLASDASPINNISDCRTKQACNTARFAGARLTNDLKEGITHILIGEDRSTERDLRRKISG